MDITLNQHNQTLNAKLSGVFTFDDNRAFRSLIDGVKAKKMRFVSINLEQLEQIDSAGLGMLILLHNEAKQQNISVTLIRPRTGVRKMFELSRFDDLFHIEH